MKNDKHVPFPEIIEEHDYNEETIKKIIYEKDKEIAELKGEIYQLRDDLAIAHQEVSVLKAENKKLRGRLSCEVCSKEVPLEDFMMCEDCYTKDKGKAIFAEREKVLDEIENEFTKVRQQLSCTEDHSGVPFCDANYDKNGSWVCIDDLKMIIKKLRNWEAK